MELKKAKSTAEKIADELGKMNEVDKIDIAGSIRRKEPEVGDIDILVSSKYPKGVIDRFTSMKSVLKVLAKGDKKASVILRNKMQADLRVVPKSSFGAAMQYFTGSKDHNIKLREIAMKKGYKLSEYGLFDKKTGKKAAGATERGIYKKLGLPYIEPEKRKNKGELKKSRE